ncbi:MAG: NAD-dependent epimerase/dehydratase family protein [Ignavibacteria bacterium]|nr:NAD-dependent epimerase/dehydratase family protein [Ignavibacteria bacterium]
MQTILGAGGAAGTELARQLINFTDQIRIVSRNPKKVNKTDELMALDLSNPNSLDLAIKGSDIVYVTIAFEYKTKVWKEKWPAFINNLIESCKKHNSKIVFVDNMYMYDPNHLSNMTEETPINPISEKGKIRAEIFNRLMNAVERKEITALVARGADFYGPGVTGSYLTQTVTNNLIKDKNPQWLGKLDVVHNFTYSVDIGKAVALLGNTNDAYNQVWHLPTTGTKLTSRQWIELFLKEMNKQKKIQAIPTFMLGILGLFIPVLKELKDISYQVENDYFFDSSKFNRHFNFIPTSPEGGVKEIVNHLTKQSQ